MDSMRSAERGMAAMGEREESRDIWGVGDGGYGFQSGGGGVGCAGYWGGA